MRSLVGLSAPKCGCAKGEAFWILVLLLASAANSPAQVVAAIDEFPVPTANSMPVQITPGPDGALWFTELSGGKIGRINTSGAIRITEYPVPGTPDIPSNPGGITAGPDGALWFTDLERSNIGRITTSGEFTLYRAPRIPHLPEVPAGITVGPDGALWFTEYGGAAIGRITTSGVTNMYPVTRTVRSLISDFAITYYSLCIYPPN